MKKETREFVVANIFAILFIIPIALILGYVFSLFVDGWAGPLTVFQHRGINILGVALVLILAIVLLVTKKNFRMYYGVVEVAFSLAAGWQAMSKVNSAGTTELLTLVAAIYFAVRGFDNMVNAYEDKTIGPVARIRRENNKVEDNKG